MNYNKPEITSLASASLVIQGVNDKSIYGHDIMSPIYQTNPPYEADE